MTGVTIAGYMTRGPILSEADDFPRRMGLPGGGEARVGERTMGLPAARKRASTIKVARTSLVYIALVGEES